MSEHFMDTAQSITSLSVGLEKNILQQLYAHRDTKVLEYYTFVSIRDLFDFFFFIYRAATVFRIRLQFTFSTSHRVTVNN